MKSNVPMIQTLSENFLTTGCVLILLAGVCTILFSKRGFERSRTEGPHAAAPASARMFGYVISSIIVVIVCFTTAYIYSMGFVPPLLVLAAVSLIGLPSILMLEQYPWFLRDADNGTMGASVGLGFVGAAYSFFVLDVLWSILKLTL